MPRKYGYKKRKNFKSRNRYRQRRYRKYSKPTTKTSLTTTGIPDRQVIKFKYSTVITLGGMVATTDVYTFRGNSLYDPDYTGSGGQCTGYDEWAAFYYRYKVFASKIDIQFLNQNTTTANASTIASVMPEITPITTSYATANLPMLPYNRYTLLTPSSAGNNPRKLKHYMSTRKMFGIEGDLDNEDYGSLINFNPSKGWYWNLSLTNLKSQVFETTAMVVVTYYAELTERSRLPLST